MNVKKRLLVLLAIPLLLAISLMANAQNSSSLPVQAKERSALFPTKNSIEQGRALAEAGCVECHGLDGISTDERRPHLAGQRVIYLYREMLAYREGDRENQDMQ